MNRTDETSTGRSGELPGDYHELYDDGKPYEESFRTFFCERYTIDLIRAIWGWSPPYRLLDGGSANGLTLGAFAGVGVEAWGVEVGEDIHSRTPAEWRERNRLGDIRRLPFPDGFVDFVYDTSLCYLPELDFDQAVRELFRVCRVGVFFGGITTDMTPTVLTAYDALDGVPAPKTLPEWSTIFLRNGFLPATDDPRALRRAWKIETDANEQGSPWYQESLTRHCFYSRPDAPSAPARKPKPRSRRRPAV